MATQLRPGSTITLTLKKAPTNAAACKTLSRLFAKDPIHRKARRTRKKLLTNQLEVRRRGGRPWEVRSKAPRLVQPTQGDACTILATPDVIRDLGSVERFITVKAAG